MTAAIAGLVVFWLTRRAMILLWEFPGPADAIVREMPRGVRSVPGLRAALAALNRSSRDTDDFLVDYRKKNPEIADWPTG